MIFSNESELIQKAKAGDEGSFETLILSCKGKAYNIALRYMKDENDAMDVLQDSFIKIFRSLPSFNEDSRFDTWVYRIVVNSCTDFLRKKKTQYLELYDSGEDSEEGVLKIPDTAPPPEEQLLNKEQGDYILQCLDKLSFDQKEIIILRDIRQFSYEEISEILGCSMGTVKSRISRARNRLKEIYLNNNS